MDQAENHEGGRIDRQMLDTIAKADNNDDVYNAILVS
jgi:hypothetical protein